MYIYLIYLIRIMATTSVKELFNLPANEDIFDDFSCKEGGLISGRLYLTTNNMCFFSSIMGITKKLIFPWSVISCIEKHSSNSIKVKRIREMNNKKTEDVTTFSGFSDRDTSYKYIYRLWLAKSPHAADMSSEDSDEDPQHQQAPSEHVPKPVLGKSMSVAPAKASP
jgi:hypothetical protein